MKTPFISGLGPGHLENEDLLGTGMHPGEPYETLSKMYLLDGVNHHPRSFTPVDYPAHERREHVLATAEQLKRCSIIDGNNI